MAHLDILSLPSCLSFGVCKFIHCSDAYFSARVCLVAQCIQLPRQGCLNELLHKQTMIGLIHCFVGICSLYPEDALYPYPCKLPEG
eukprot:scaffold48637_cov28-Tisochrysis_lutea.AAC.2